MISQLASFREFLNPTDYLVEVLPGGGDLSASSINLYFQSSNRCGLNLPGEAITVSFNDGDGIRITWQNTAMLSGEEVFYLVISGETTGDPQDAVILSSLQTRSADGNIIVNLPTSIVLNKDEHLNTNKLVADSSQLPSGDNLIEGAIALIDGVEQTYLYSAQATLGEFSAVGKTGFWITTYLPYFSFVANTQQGQGCDRPLFDLGADDYLSVSPRQTGTDSAGCRYWIYNDAREDSGTVITAGTKFDLEVLINERSLPASRLAGIINFGIIGQVRKSTGVLYTDIAGANVVVAWNPALSQLITVEQNILPGYALVIEISFTKVADRLLDKGYIKPNESIRIVDLYPIASEGVKSDLWELTGDAVLPGADVLRVVPNKVLAGSALIKGYRIKNYSSQPLVGVESETAGQLVAISGSTGGDVSVYQDAGDMLPTEAVRAVIGTSSGFYTPTEESATLIIDTNGAIVVSVVHPYAGNQQAIIRADYPDTKIALLLGVWHNPKIRVYLLKDSVLYYRRELIESESQVNQTIRIETLDDFEPALLVPSNRDRYFGLYALKISVVPEANGGTLPQGAYSLFAAYEDPSPNSAITSINHTTSDCIPERLEIFDRDLSYWKKTDLTIAEARELKQKDLFDGAVYGIRVSSKSYTPFVFKSDETASDNATSVIKPTFLGSSPGAFIPLPTLGHRFISSNGLLPARHRIRVQGEGVSVADNSNETVITVAAVPVGQITADTNAIWEDGSLIEWEDGTIL